MSIKKSLEWYTQSCFGDIRRDGIMDFFPLFYFLFVFSGLFSWYLWVVWEVIKLKIINYIIKR